MADEEDGNHRAGCIIHCTDDQSPLTNLRDIQSWETLVKAAKVRKHAAVLQLADEIPDGSFPLINYHRSCRQIFTMKSLLEAIMKSSKSEITDDASAPQRTSLRNKCVTSSSSAILPTVCIFCEKDTKFMKKSKTREKLTRSCEMRADIIVRRAAKQRNDQRMLSVTANELHASEAFYHQSCYRNYTRVLYKLPNIDDDANPTDGREISFDKARDYVYQKFKEQQTVEFSTVRAKMQNELELLNVDTASIQTALHNLKRSIERNCTGVHFTKGADGKLLLFSKDRDIEILIAENYNTEKELNAMMRSNDEEKQIINAACTIRKEILSMEDTLPWPPREQDLAPVNVRINKSLSLFLTVLLTGSQKSGNSPRTNRLIKSYAQDIIYSVSKELFPKNFQLRMNY